MLYDRRQALFTTVALGAAGLMASAGVSFANDNLEIIDPASAPADAHKTDIKDMVFTEPEITVKAGSVVVWTNQDEIAHNVHFRGGPAKGFDKAQGPMLNHGQSYAVKFNALGEYKYFCTPHSMVMKGVVKVEG